MKIGWSRLTMLVELDLNQVTTGFAGMRTGYMRQLIEEGHEIKILTPMGKKSIESYEFIKKGGDPKELGPWDCSWIKGVDYQPSATAEDCELLIVESSAVQWMFGCSVTQQPAIRRCVDILNSFKGVVVIEQSDPDLPFPFGKLGMVEKSWSDESNPYRLGIATGHEELESYGWANPEEIWDNKQYIVCTRTSDPDKILADGMSNGVRFRYTDAKNQHGVKFKSMPQTYDFDHHNVKLGTEENKKCDLIYTGFPRSDTREKRFDALFLDMEGPVIKAVCGPWEKSKRDYKMYDLLLGCVTYAGNLPWADLPVFISEAKFSLFLGVSKSYKLDWATNKPFESISSGAILLYDEIDYLVEMLGSNFVINNSNRKNWSNVIINISDEERKTIAQWQYNQIRKYDWAYYITRLAKVTGLKGLKTLKPNMVTAPLYNDGGTVIHGILAKYWNDDTIPSAQQGNWDKRKLEFDEEARKSYAPPTCYGESYEEAVSFCHHTCPFRTECKTITQTPKPTAQETQEQPAEQSETVSTPLASTCPPAPTEPPEILPTQPTVTSKIWQLGDASRVVIEVAGKVDLTVVSNAYTITIKTGV